MGLLSGAASVTRFNLPVRPQEIDFEPAAFRAIAPGSEVRESAGFVPVEPGAGYQVGAGRWAFRVRVDRLRADPTTVRERTKQLVAAEMEATGAPFVGPKKRRQLRNLAEEELIVQASPRSKIIECAIDGDVLYVASTAKGQLGQVVTLLRRVGVTAEPKAPWVDRQDADPETDLVDMREPGESVLGCRFLRGLLGDRVLAFEPEAGRVVLQTSQARVTLAGEVLPDLLRYAERGAEVLSAKLTTGEVAFRLDGPSWRVSGLRVDTDRHEHWIGLLDERLEKISAVFDLLDAKYAELDPARRPAPVVREAAGGGGGGVGSDGGRVVPIRNRSSF
jgi:hypothetical protein